MTDEELKAYLPHEGDRVAARFYSRKSQQRTVPVEDPIETEHKTTAHVQELQKKAF